MAAPRRGDALPQHGDVLDRALHAARTQAPPSDAVNQKGFFRAVAGTRSPINNQSSRIPKPNATHAFLGGGTTPTVATPEQQALLALPQAKNGQPQARKIEQEYVKGADTQKVIPAHTIGMPGRSGVQGAATTGADPAAVFQRGAGLVASGVSLGDSVLPFLSAASKLGVPNVDRQQLIGGIAKDKTLDQPNIRAELAGAIKANGNTLPANANTRQMLQAAFLPEQHHGSYWDAVNPVNILKDAIYTPLYTAQGGAALGHASREALPKGLGGQGDTTDLAAIGKSQLSMVEHPGAFVQQHPFQAALMAIGAAKGVGGIAGKVAKLPETARDVTLSRYPLTPINRGTLDQNLVTRAAQKTSDAILAKGPETFQSNVLKNRVVGTQSRIVRERALEDRKVYSEYKDAGKGIKPREKQSLLQNAAQGITPAEREAFYRSLDETPTRAAQANLANAQGERFGNGPLTEKQQAFVDAARKLAQHRAQTLKDAGDLSPAAELRNDQQTLMHVRASQGDATATNILSVEGDLRSWMEQPLPKDPDLRAYRDQRIQQLNEEHDALSKQFASEQDANPFRVGKQKPKVASQFDYPGRAVRANANLPVAGIGKSRTFGDQLRSGNFEQSHRTFEKQLFEPNTRADARRFVEAVGDPKSGLGAVPAENGRLLTDIEKENYTLLNRSNLRTKPKNADRTIDAADATNKEAELVRTAKDLNAAFEQPGLDRVPDDGDFVLVPNPVKAQVDSQVARVRPGSAEHRIAQATRGFKTGVLSTRPSFPITQGVNGVFQGGIVGTGPTSYARAIRGSLPTMPGIEDSGFVAREFGHAASQTARGYLDEGRPMRALRQATIGNYIKGIKNATIGVDNLSRKATGNKLAVTEAKKLLGWGKVHRGIGRVNQDVIDMLQKMADGDTPEARAAAERVLQGVNDVHGDYSAMRANGLIDAAIPFHRWSRFITKLMLKTLPLKYPGRTLAGYQVGNVGQQAADQQGMLPPWLASVVGIAGNPLARYGLDLTKAIPFTSLGTTFDPDANGNPNPQGIISQLSPYLGIGYGAATGKDLETGNPLLNGAGKPITSYGDRLRYIGAQTSGFFPLAGAAAGGLSGKPATSIPFPGLTQNLPPRKDGSPRTNAREGPTIDVLGHKIPIIPLVNQVIPGRVTLRNEEADQLKGFKAAVSQYRKEAKAQWAALASQPGQAAKVQARYEQTMAQATKNAAYFEKNPKALAALLASGTGGK